MGVFASSSARRAALISFASGHSSSAVHRAAERPAFSSVHMSNTAATRGPCCTVFSGHSLTPDSPTSLAASSAAARRSRSCRACRVAVDKLASASRASSCNNSIRMCSTVKRSPTGAPRTRRLHQVAPSSALRTPHAHPHLCNGIASAQHRRQQGGRRLQRVLGRRSRRLLHCTATAVEPSSQWR